MARHDLGDHTPGELRLIVARERAALVAEKAPLLRRIKAIDARIAELDKAEALLEGMD